MKFGFSMFAGAGLVALAVAVPAGAAAQEPAGDSTARNAVYVEALGNGLVYSLNYEREVAPRWWLRLGAGWVGSGGAFPVTASYLAGTAPHHLEIGAGPLLVVWPDFGDEAGDLGSTGGTSLLGTGTVGYRYQPQEGGLMFRIGATPVFSLEGLLVWAGVSLGYAF